MSLPAVSVGIARVRGAAEPVARTLRTVSLTTPGLGQDAFLIVLHLSDPLPGALQRGDGPAWAHRTQDALAALLRTAANPADGPVPAGTRSVFFPDRSQLLASLAEDWVSGVLLERWWWRELLRIATSGEPVPVIWRGNGREIPQALGILECRGSLEPFVQRLGSRAWSLAGAMALAWGAPAACAAQIARCAEPTGLAGPVPWGPEPPSFERLPPGPRVLAGLGLALARSPAATTRLNRWVALTRWLENRPEPASVRRREQGSAPEQDPGSGQARGPGRPPLGERSTRLAQLDRTTRHPGTAGGPDARISPAPQRHEPEPLAAGDQLPDPRTTVPDGGLRRVDSPAPATAAPFVGSTTRVDEQIQPPRIQVSWPAPQEPAPADGAARASLARRETPLAAERFSGPTALAGADLPAADTAARGVRTRYGGIFYLLNVAIDSGLYGDFTQPRTPGIPLSPWDLIGLLGRRLLQSPDPADGIWPLLNTLAGRGPDTSHRTPRAMRRWLDRRADLVEASLRTVLRCTHGGTRLIRTPAAVQASLARVDVRLPLEHLPIEVRLAGLDRDPGWIPAAGRTVTFHFD